ncbi:hypothetical protein NQ314_002714 [Rhamnusium bicolor]|uniref:Uncharacterized protein n=1 Tax=Rhamnusium bicolor TaxID=1586634 RepID=A0AAV8ZNG1_9CUCU|nr:hypothetical protein NQ314_002714 [Rhamnusium bicolor]
MTRNWNHNDIANHISPATPEEGDCLTTISSLSQRIESELRSAKRTHLACGEVLLPCGLLQRISSDIISMAESEPCGLRGCKLYLLFETSEHCIRLGTVQCDLTTASTFELYLTLKQSSTGWHFFAAVYQISYLSVNIFPYEVKNWPPDPKADPDFLAENLTRGGTIVVSPAYTLSKKKLYRSYREE